MHWVSVVEEAEEETLEGFPLDCSSSRRSGSAVSLPFAAVVALDPLQ